MDVVEIRVKKIVAEQLRISEDQIKPKAAFSKDTCIDPLDLIELIMALEKEFGIEIPDQEADKIKNFNDVVAFVKSRAKLKPA